MRLITVVCLLFVAAFQVNGQDVSAITSGVFNQLLNSVVSQWGNMSSTDLTAFIDKLTKPGGLNHIWNAIDSHCNTHFDCGPDACCLKPTHLGKRGFTDGINLHMSSYCSPLKKAGQTCSLFHSGETTSTFSCPCAKGFNCVPAHTFQIHPLISIHKEPICQVA
ncbi:unnamed protein product [Rotaria sp. Silwood1]|nr:unnamed protein product [Rotaria sp. Silwood1]CAF1111398.1 unnamed protein product [Rotaria sp. Silwood1]CAF3474435.1 unnamed protein product [Rotaria sp. Silwood1]CAF4631724.1 unnamed protein product [Rotaria sp. Silwood1]